jgi:hypothetical protein
MPHNKQRATPPVVQSARPPVGRLGAAPFGVGGSLRRLPDALHRAAHRAYPGDPTRTHERGRYFRPLVLGPNTKPAVEAVREAERRADAAACPGAPPRGEPPVGLPVPAAGPAAVWEFEASAACCNYIINCIGSSIAAGRPRRLSGQKFGRLQCDEWLLTSREPTWAGLR